MNSRVTGPDGKPYGIAVRLPEGDPMSAPHLLGEEWSGTRWFATAEGRDAALAAMKIQPAYYRKGDSPSVELETLDP